jgi:hypothetical protein
MARSLIPLMLRTHQRLLDQALQSGGEIKFEKLSWRMAFEVALRSTMGSLFSDKEVDEWYDDYIAFIKGFLAPVWLLLILV